MQGQCELEKFVFHRDPLPIRMCSVSRERSNRRYYLNITKS